jgi:threonine/homoserine/homoserine lactone efflux protein
MLDLVAFIFINLLGVMSPGPDFAMVTTYSLLGSRKAALYATFGIGAALLIHVLYCVSGIAIFLSASPKLMAVLRILGALYLGFLGITLLKKQKEGTIPIQANLKGAFRSGFYTNLLNPKATIFLLSLFSQFAVSMNTFGMKVAFGLSVPTIAISWFASLSYFLTHPRFLPFMQKHQRKFMCAMGLILICLSLIGLFSI